jgi:hypothetical protein
MSKMKIAEARSTKALMKHPVFEQEYDFKEKYGLSISDDRMFELKKIFAIANQNGSGIIGRKNFVDLMALLRISPTEVRTQGGGLSSGGMQAGRGAAQTVWQGCCGRAVRRVWAARTVWPAGGAGRQAGISVRSLLSL